MKIINVYITVLPRPICFSRSINSCIDLIEKVKLYIVTKVLTLGWDTSVTTYMYIVKMSVQISYPPLFLKDTSVSLKIKDIFTLIPFSHHIIRLEGNCHVHNHVHKEHFERLNSHISALCICYIHYEGSLQNNNHLNFPKKITLSQHEKEFEHTKGADRNR